MSLSVLSGEPCESSGTDPCCSGLKIAPPGVCGIFSSATDAQLQQAADEPHLPQRRPRGLQQLHASDLLERRLPDGVSELPDSRYGRGPGPESCRGHYCTHNTHEQKLKNIRPCSEVTARITTAAKKMVKSVILRSVSIRNISFCH